MIIFRGLVSISEYSERVEILMAMGAGDYFLEILRKSEDETLINFTLTVIGNVISSSEGNFFLYIYEFFYRYTVHCNAAHRNIQFIAMPSSKLVFTICWNNILKIRSIGTVERKRPYIFEESKRNKVEWFSAKNKRGIVCWILANICSGEPNSFCFILTDEALMNKLMIYAIEAEWKIKQHALTGIILNEIV